MAVGEVLETPVRKLSLGQRMKCELIAALLHTPKILFLDEPTIGLDVVMQQVLLDFIAQYNREFGATILLTSHYMDDVKSLCKRVLVIDHGVIIYDGKLEKLISDYAHEKFISVTAEKELGRDLYKKYGRITSWMPPKVTIAVPRARTTEIVTQMLAKIPIIDIEITEPEIEDVIRHVFGN